MTRRLDQLALLAAFLLLWQGLHLWAGDVALTAPIATLATLADLLGTARFWANIAETGRALALSLVIACVGGLGLGVWLGAHKLSGEVGEPILVALYALPKVTLYPLILLLFGLGLSAKVAFGAIHGIVPIAIFAMGAVRHLSPVLIRAARSLHLGPGQTVLHVLMPAALPEIVSGLRVGFSLTLLGVLIGEMFASQRGLGFMIINAIGINDVPTMMATTVLIAVFAIGVNAGLIALDRRLGGRASAR